MTHLRPINQKAARIAEGLAEARRRAAAGNGPTAGGEDGRVVALQDSPAQPPQQEGPHIPLGCSFIFLPGWEADSNGGRGGPVPAGRARPVRLPPRLLLAGAGAGPVESRPRLDGQMRRGAEGLAED